MPSRWNYHTFILSETAEKLQEVQEKMVKITDGAKESLRRFFRDRERYLFGYIPPMAEALRNCG